MFHSHVHVVPRYRDDDVILGYEAGDLEEYDAEEVRAAIGDAL